MTPATTFLLLFAIVTEVAREIFFKSAADNTIAEKSYFWQLVKSPKMWVGLVLWAAEIIAWIMVLARAPLSVAFPLMSLCYCGVLLASWWFLDEKISRRKWIGVISITIGVAIVGSTGI